MQQFCSWEGGRRGVEKLTTRNFGYFLQLLLGVLVNLWQGQACPNS
uniref:Uncharacterized protein n=1 Tax=Rhizophora mucronata TaxID=61149 RepID=A0A2P2QJZ2_RHIMU